MFTLKIKAYLKYIGSVPTTTDEIGLNEAEMLAYRGECEKYGLDQSLVTETLSAPLLLPLELYALINGYDEPLGVEPVVPAPTSAPQKAAKRAQAATPAPTPEPTPAPVAVVEEAVATTSPDAAATNEPIDTGFEATTAAVPADQLPE